MHFSQIRLEWICHSGHHLCPCPKVSPGKPRWMGSLQEKGLGAKQLLETRGSGPRGRRKSILSQITLSNQTLNTLTNHCWGCPCKTLGRKISLVKGLLEGALLGVVLEMRVFLKHCQEHSLNPLSLGVFCSASLPHTTHRSEGSADPVPVSETSLRIRFTPTCASHPFCVGNVSSAFKGTAREAAAPQRRREAELG